MRSLFVGGLLLLGCGSEVGRLAFDAEGERESTVTLKPGDVAFWADLDIAYDGPAMLQYKVELQQNGATVASASCNPLGSMSVKIGWVETNLSERHTRSGSGKMSCGASLPQGGPTVVKASLAWAQKPATLKLSKADLVLKQ